MHISEFTKLVQEETDNDQLYEMANIFSHTHGIENVVIWVGRANKHHGLRVKVSNVPNKMDPENNFVIQMPSLDYDPGQVAAWIAGRKLKMVLQWIVLNQKILYDYEQGLNDDTGVFLDNIAKVSE